MATVEAKDVLVIIFGAIAVVLLLVVIIMLERVYSVVHRKGEKPMGTPGGTGDKAKK